MQGERNEMHAPDHAANLKDLLTGVEGGAILFTIVGGFFVPDPPLGGNHFPNKLFFFS